MKAHVGEPLAQPRRELARRVNGGIQVTLYWSPFDNSTTVEVGQTSSEETLVFAVAPERALEAFYHPFRAARSTVRRAGPRRRRVSLRRCTLQAGRRVFPPAGDGSVLGQRCGGL